MAKCDKKVRILVAEPWDGGVLTAKLIEAKDRILLFSTETPIVIGNVKTKRFFGEQRHVENTGHYNFYCIKRVDDFSIDDIEALGSDKGGVEFFMIGSVESI